ncbi:hypothetical protein CCACVL1_13652 [Corchorus capsularis]|uniref:Transcription initiation factor IIE subunit beta n=1 Tax=Corchorus capsularis TaxID=210143 RepID=A0A1R3IA46_COCAP|nr:hypothetical protein CCACVL1_13652 [Corchorus capsularis]
MLSNNAAKSASSRTTITLNPAPVAASPFPSAGTPAPVKFSIDTQRFQQIYNIRKAPVGAQLKRVIDLLFKTRKAFTAEQINEACYVDVNGNKDVFEGLRNNPKKVEYDGMRFSYKAMKAEGSIWLLPGSEPKDYIAFPNDPNPRVSIKVDDDLKALFHEIDVKEQDMSQIEKDLLKYGMKPATNTAKRRSIAAQMQGTSSKPKPRKKNKFSKRAKLTNSHLPELFQDP